MDIKKINRLFAVFHGNKRVAGKNQDKQTGTDEPVKDSSTAREKVYFDEETLRQQRLYERWVCREIWLLQSEGIPLLLGKDPQCNTDRVDFDQYKRDYNDLWGHAKRCVEQNLLPVLNRQNIPEAWEIRPADLYRWATISRISVLEPLSRLMDFVIRTVKHQPGTSSEEGENTAETGSSHTYTETLHNHRECVLGAAMAMLARYPERCRDSKSNIKSELIVSLINKKRGIWFGDDKLLLSPSAMQNLLDKYLKTIE